MDKIVSAGLTHVRLPIGRCCLFLMPCHTCVFGTALFTRCEKKCVRVVAAAGHWILGDIDRKSKWFREPYVNGEWPYLLRMCEWARARDIQVTNRNPTLVERPRRGHSVGSGRVGRRARRGGAPCAWPLPFW